MSESALDDDAILKRMQNKRLGLLDVLEPSAYIDPKVAKVYLGGLKDAESIVMSKKKLAQDAQNSQDVQAAAAVLLAAASMATGAILDQARNPHDTVEVQAIPIPVDIDGVLDEIDVPEHEIYIGTEVITFEQIVGHD